MGRNNRGFAPNRTASDWLSRDPVEVDRFEADPLCGAPLSAQAWAEFLEGRRRLGESRHLRHIPKYLPVLLIAGTRDPVGENGSGVLRLYDAWRTAGLRRVGLALHEGARHELLNETTRESVTAHVIEWLHGVAPGDEHLASVGNARAQAVLAA